MSGPVIYLDVSDVRPGCLQDLKAAMTDLAQFVETHEDQLLSYQVYFSEEETRVAVLHVNPDSASLRRHLEVAGPKFPPIGAFLDQRSIDVFGEVEDDIIERLRNKARLLGTGVVRVHDLHAGFSRLIDPRVTRGG